MRGLLTFLIGIMQSPLLLQMPKTGRLRIARIQTSRQLQCRVLYLVLRLIFGLSDLQPGLGRQIPPPILHRKLRTGLDLRPRGVIPDPQLQLAPLLSHVSLADHGVTIEIHHKFRHLDHLTTFPTDQMDLFRVTA
jgi:hypothetical protein